MALVIALSAFGGAVLGWGIFTGFYISIKRALDNHPFGWYALKQPASAGFWRTSGELVAGFAIIKVESLEEAIEWVKRAPNCSPNGEGEIEIRKLMDIEDFGDGFTPNPEIAKVKFR